MFKSISLEITNEKRLQETASPNSVAQFPDHNVFCAGSELLSNDEKITEDDICHLPFSSFKPANNNEVSPARNARALLSMPKSNDVKGLVNNPIGQGRAISNLQAKICSILLANFKYQARQGARALDTTSIDTFFAELHNGPVTIKREDGTVEVCTHLHCIIKDVLLPMRKLSKMFDSSILCTESPVMSAEDIINFRKSYDFCVHAFTLSNALLKQLWQLLTPEQRDIVFNKTVPSEKTLIDALSPMRVSPEQRADSRSYIANVYSSADLPSSEGRQAFVDAINTAPKPKRPVITLSSRLTPSLHPVNFDVNDHINPLTSAVATPFAKMKGLADANTSSSHFTDDAKSGSLVRSLF